MDRFYEYLDDEGYTQINPFSGIRKKISLIRTTQEAVEIKRITNFQWDYVMRSANALADNDAKYERHLFVITLLKTHFLRVSDFAPCYETIPKMNDFVKTTEGWIFKALGKGNKLRNIALKDVSLDALKRYRSALGLSILPTPSDDSYLLPLSSKRKKPYISSTRSIQQHVDMIFKHAINRMMEDGLEEESLELQSASSHWLRHTGISEDVKTRPLNDVRMDAGHSTIATTTGYMGSTLQERIESAKNQPL
jgi:integrase